MGRCWDAEGGVGLTYSPGIGRLHGNFDRILAQPWGGIGGKGLLRWGQRGGAGAAAGKEAGPRPSC